MHMWYMLQSHLIVKHNFTSHVWVQNHQRTSNIQIMLDFLGIIKSISKYNTSMLILIASIYRHSKFMTQHAHQLRPMYKLESFWHVYKIKSNLFMNYNKYAFQVLYVLKYNKHFLNISLLLLNPICMVYKMLSYNWRSPPLPKWCISHVIDL